MSLEEYRDFLATNERSLVTIRNYLYVLEDFSSFIHHKPFKKVTSRDVSRYIEVRRNKGNCTGSILHYAIILKSFYKWLYQSKEPPVQVSHINIKTPRTIPMKPSEIISKDDVVSVLRVCRNFYEKALVSCLYESACRIGEFMEWRIGDIVLDKYGAVLSVNGKTGERRIRLVESVPQLQLWLNIHPFRHLPSAYVWGRKNKKPRHPVIYKQLRRLFKIAGLNKPFNPHAFRHSRLTELAKHLSDGKLKVFAGWVGSSRMAGTYVHLSGVDLDNDLLKAAGVQIPSEQEVSPLKPLVCSRCQEVNPGEAEFCLRCGLPFNAEKLLEEEYGHDVLELLNDSVIKEKFKKWLLNLE